jgi:F-type H+-transporting ATPase subunit gamma
MAGARDIKRRIKSVKNTKKITRAMQMVSAAKMRRAQNAVMSSRTYAELAWQIISSLGDSVDPKFHALLNPGNPSGKTGIILVSSNKGLIGGFNTNLISFTKKYIQEHGLDADILADFIVMGRRGRDSIIRARKNVVAEFPKQERRTTAEEIQPLVKMVMDEYIKGTYSKIVVIYTHYVSTITQRPAMRQLLPMKYPKMVEEDKKPIEYLFEPTPEKVFEHLLPRIIESQIYRAILESDASEHSARMITMKNATDSATELIDDLTLTYNQLRQANITKELAEITAGRIAIE